MRLFDQLFVTTSEVLTVLTAACRRQSIDCWNDLDICSDGQG